MELKLSSITDSLNEQQWFQELKGKWEELDPQSRAYLRIAGLVGGVLLFLYLILSSLWHVHSLKAELAAKSDLLLMVQNANDEMRRLRETGTPPMQAQGGAWNAYFEQIAGTAGIDKGDLTVSGEKQASGPKDVLKETLYELTVKKVTIRQVVKYAYFLENQNGGRPVKIRNLTIDTNADPSGYMGATLAVSAFSMNEAKR